MSLAKFPNIDAAVAHAKQLRQAPMTSAQVVELVTLEAELVNLGIGYVAPPIASTDVAPRAEETPVKTRAPRAKAEKPDKVEKSAPRLVAQDDDKPVSEERPEGF